MGVRFPHQVPLSMIQEDINKVLQEILQGISEHFAQHKFKFERQYDDWNVRYYLCRDDVKQDFSLPLDFVIDVVLGLFPVNEFISGIIYELTKTDKNLFVS
jgi:hypothetical protein